MGPEDRGKTWLVPEYDEEYFYDFTVKERGEIKEIVQPIGKKRTAPIA